MSVSWEVGSLATIDSLGPEMRGAHPDNAPVKNYRCFVHPVHAVHPVAPHSPGEVSRCAQTRVGGDNEFDRAAKTCMLRGLNFN
jgi:hypothetical protein